MASIKKVRRNGVCYVYTVESHSVDGHQEQRIIASHGREDDLLAKDPQAIDKLKAEAHRLTIEHRNGRGLLAYDTNLPSDGGQPANLGWLLVDAMLAGLAPPNTDTDTRQALAEMTTQALWAYGDHSPAADYGFYGRSPAALTSGASLNKIAGLAQTMAQRASPQRNSAGTTKYLYIATVPSAKQPGQPVCLAGLFLTPDGRPQGVQVFRPDATAERSLAAAVKQAKAEPGRVVVIRDGPFSLAHLNTGSDGWISCLPPHHADPGTQQWLDDEAGWGISGEFQIKSRRTTLQVPTGSQTTRLHVKQVARRAYPVVHEGCELLLTSEVDMADDDVISRYEQLRHLQKTLHPSHMPTAKASGLTRAKTHVHVAHLAMVVTAVLEQRTGLPASQLPEALSALEAVDCGDDTWRLRRSPLWDTIDEALGCALDQSWLTPAQIETWHEQLIEPESTKGNQPSA